MVSALGKPQVLLLSFEENSLFDQLYQRVLGKLNTEAALSRVTKPESILRLLADQLPHAILVTDGSIARHRDVCAGLHNYVRGGGRLILMGNFSSTIKPKDLDKFFQEAGLPWTHAEYLRTTVQINNSKEALPTFLPSSYSQKAVFLANVSVKDAWYLPTDASRTESLVFHSERIHDLKQTPIALTNIGEGKLGYVGDVNGEEGSDAVVLAMCGLSYTA